MAKEMRTGQLDKEVTEAIICLAAEIPLYAIRLEDICSLINEKYGLVGKQCYLTGSILASLERMSRVSLNNLEVSYAEQIELLTGKLLRSSKNKAERLGRWRRTSLYIYLLAQDYVWKQMSPMTSVFKYNLPAVLKLKLITDAFIGFRVTSASLSEKFLDGMREVFFVEAAIPVGMKMVGQNGKNRWVEPISPCWIRFASQLDDLIKELQSKKIFIYNLPASAIRQTFIGSMMGLAFGKILSVRIEPNHNSSVIGYSHEQALFAIRQNLRGMCLNEKALAIFDHDWPAEK